MGVVHRCFDRLGRREVAYKRLRSGEGLSGARAVALFRREYDTLVRLAHPNIVEVYDYGFDTHGPYYVMELLDGEDLRGAARRPLFDDCLILRDVASALALLHARRFVHRDVTPANVRITDDGRAKLIDFGALASFGPTTEIVGTPAFIAPECLRQEPLDQRADLYALGALAYWLLTRRLHVRAQTLDDLEDAWCEVITPPSAYVREIPPALDALILALLHPERAARPASASDVIERLTAIAGLPPERQEREVAFGYLKHPPLIGRTSAIASLEGALERAIDGRGQVAWIEGERGVGRTALLDRLTVAAQVRGATVVRATCSLHEGPFSVARHLLELGHAMSPPTRGDVAPDSVAHAIGIGASSPQSAPLRTAIDLSERQTAISCALGASLLELSERGPMVVLIDDAQHADRESLSLFASLLDSIPHQRILLVLTAPMRQLDEPTVKLARAAVGCALGALTEADFLELTTSVFGHVPNAQRLAVQLHRRTGGNPGVALDLARLLIARGTIRYAYGTFVLPHELADDVMTADQNAAQLARLFGISDSARMLAELLALHDGPLPPELLAEALELDVATALRAIEALLSRSVVSSAGEHVTLASEALRAVLLQQLLPDAAQRGHRALARALFIDDSGSLGSSLAIARHLLLAGAPYETEGARLVAKVGAENRYEAAVMARGLPIFERALTVLKAEGLSDAECVGVLVPLSLAGFYGDLALQRRYLDRTLIALSEVCGFSLAKRLRPYLGARIALLLGLLIAWLTHRRSDWKLNRRPFLENIAAFSGILAPATAAFACTYDVAETLRIARYCEPFAGAPKGSGLYCVWEFCLATAELIAGRARSARSRYAYVFEVFKRPVRGMDDALREQASLGCLNGQAYALVTEGSERALAYADELAERGVFYLPHAECVRMSFHAQRGDAARALVHRERAEAAALRGGMSWSALCTLSVHSMHASVLARDVVALVRVVADLQRLAKLSPSLAALAALGEAHLAQLRGNPREALAIYERVWASEHARLLPTRAIDATVYAQALGAVGEHEKSKAVCISLLDEPPTSDSPSASILPRQQLAAVEAALGNRLGALQLLDQCLTLAAATQNPLTLGSLHRDAAQLAALAGDVAAFEKHSAAMRAHFESTQNAALLQQCEALRMEAIGLGLLGHATTQHVADALDGEVTLGKTHVATTLERESKDRVG
jgi:hypothetical protein